MIGHHARRFAWLAWVALAFGLGSIGCAEAQQAAQRLPCDCAVADAIISRINAADAAIAAYDEEIGAIKAEEARTGEKVTVGSAYDQVLSWVARKDTGRETLQGHVDAAIADVQMPGAKLGKARTTADCEPEITQSAGACIDRALLVHEQVHVEACKAKPRSGDMRLVEYAEEEKRGYRAEIDWLTRQLGALPASCRPHGWVGSIIYANTDAMTSSGSIPPHGDLTSGSRHSEVSRIRNARIQYRPGQSRAWVQARNTSSSVEKFNYLVACKGGLKTAVRDRKITATKTESVDGTGEVVDAPLQVDFEIVDETCTLSFTLPAVTVGLTAKEHFKQSGSCDPAADTDSGSGSSIAEPVAFDPVSVDGTVAASARAIHGTQTFTLVPPMSADGGTMSHVIKVTWSLKRID